MPLEPSCEVRVAGLRSQVDGRLLPRVLKLRARVDAELVLQVAAEGLVPGAATLLPDRSPYVSVGRSAPDSPLPTFGLRRLAPPTIPIRTVSP